MFFVYLLIGSLFTVISAAIDDLTTFYPLPENHMDQIQPLNHPIHSRQKRSFAFPLGSTLSVSNKTHQTQSQYVS